MASYEYGGVNKREIDNDRKIFCGGLPQGLDEGTFRGFFEQFGAVKDSTIMTDKFTGNSRGFGFVTFVEKESMTRALEQSSYDIDGSRVSIKQSENRSAGGGGGAGGRGGGMGGRDGGSNQKVHCRGMPIEATEDDIRAAFGTYGTVESVDLPIDRETGTRRNFAFVSFADPSAAQRLLADRQIDVNGTQTGERGW